MNPRDQIAVTDEASLARRVAQFRERWIPTDRKHGDSAWPEREFEMQLHELLMNTYRVAQGPLLDRLAAAMAMQPNPFITKPKEPLK